MKVSSKFSPVSMRIFRTAVIKWYCIQYEIIFDQLRTERRERWNKVFNAYVRSIMRVLNVIKPIKLTILLRNDDAVSVLYKTSFVDETIECKIHRLSSKSKLFLRFCWIDLTRYFCLCVSIINRSIRSARLIVYLSLNESDLSLIYPINHFLDALRVSDISIPILCWASRWQASNFAIIFFSG